MYAVRTARAYTQRHAIIKIEGGYHGGYDGLSVSVKPDVAAAGPEDAPIPVTPFDVEAGVSTSFPTTTSSASSRSSPRTPARSLRS